MGAFSDVREKNYHIYFINTIMYSLSKLVYSRGNFHIVTHKKSIAVSVAKALCISLSMTGF